MSVVGGDWRNSPAYDYVDEMSVEKIAHEFLRRNDDYAADYAKLSADPPDQRPPAALARWGLRFRGEPSHSGRSGHHGMGSAGRSAPGAADAIAGFVVGRSGPCRGRPDPDRVCR